MAQTIARKAETGEPTKNVGHFGSRTRDEADSNLLTAAVYPDDHDPDYVEFDSFEFDGETLHITKDDNDQFQVWSSSVAEYFEGPEYDDYGDEKPSKRTPVYYRYRAIQTYAARRATDIRYRADAIPGINKAVRAEATRLDGLAANARAIAREKVAKAPKPITLF